MDGEGLKEDIHALYDMKLHNSIMEQCIHIPDFIIQVIIACFGAFLGAILCGWAGGRADPKIEKCCSSRKHPLNTKRHVIIQLFMSDRKEAFNFWSSIAFYTQFRNRSAASHAFAYNLEGVSIPAAFAMEISYRFIRASKIHESPVPHLRINKFLMKLFIRNPARRLCGILILRIILSASPSLRSLKWKNLTDLYAIQRRCSIEF